MIRSKKRSKGFTLIELVVGIVVMAIALTLISSVFFSSRNSAVEPILQVRAAAFGQALMSEILGKAFDEATPVGGVPACTAASCTAAGNLGSDGELRRDFDDVDDYNDYCDPSSLFFLSDALGNTPDHYDNFRMRVCVIYDGDFNGVSDANVNAKLITVQIYAPTGVNLSEAITFTAYRGNF